jgi:hypothetical protein
MQVHGVEIEEFPQTKVATDVKVQDQNNVNLFFDIRDIIFKFLIEETIVNQTIYMDALKKCLIDAVTLLSCTRRGESWKKSLIYSLP